MNKRQRKKNIKMNVKAFHEKLIKSGLFPGLKISNEFRYKNGKLYGNPICSIFLKAASNKIEAENKTL